MTQWRQGGYESIASLATYLEPIYHCETITFNKIRIEVALGPPIQKLTHTDNGEN